MPTKKTKPRAKARKRTSDRVSSEAGALLRALRPFPARVNFRALFCPPGGPVHDVEVSVGVVRALAASCLSQDEQKGKRGREVVKP